MCAAAHIRLCTHIYPALAVSTESRERRSLALSSSSSVLASRFRPCFLPPSFLAPSPSSPSLWLSLPISASPTRPLEADNVAIFPRLSLYYILDTIVGTTAARSGKFLSSPVSVSEYLIIIPAALPPRDCRTSAATREPVSSGSVPSRASSAFVRSIGTVRDMKDRSRTGRNFRRVSTEADARLAAMHKHRRFFRSMQLAAGYLGTPSRSMASALRVVFANFEFALMFLPILLHVRPGVVRLNFSFFPLPSPFVSLFFFFFSSSSSSSSFCRS